MSAVGGYTHPCANFDLYDAGSWRLDLSPGETARLQTVLDGAGAFHQELYAAHRALPQKRRDRMAIIAGVGYKTLFRLKEHPRFLGLWERMDKEITREPGNPHREGDGRVPLASAALEDVGELRYARAVHGALPTLRPVYEDTFRWLNVQPMRLPDTPAQALSRHLAWGDDASDALHLTGAARGDTDGGDPGYWDPNPPDPARLAQLTDQLEAGQVPEFNLLRLL